MKFNTHEEIDNYLKAVVGEYIGDRFTSIHHYYAERGGHYVKISVTVSRLTAFRIEQLSSAINKVDIKLVSWDFFGSIPTLDLTFKIGGYNG